MYKEEQVKENYCGSVKGPTRTVEMGDIAPFLNKGPSGQKRGGFNHVRGEKKGSRETTRGGKKRLKEF